MKKNWKGQLGIHAHNNTGLALSNTLQAIECGVKWVDSTITGIGRGPGNTLTEELIFELSQNNCEPIKNNLNLVPLIQIINNREILIRISNIKTIIFYLRLHNICWFRCKDV